MKFEFTVPGEPRGKGRPRFTKAGGSYTPKETVYYENHVKTCYTSQGGRYFEGAISAHIDVYMGIPQSKSIKRKAMMAAGQIRPTKKPDIDNVAKVILDSLNKIAYHDDSAVVECIVRKWYAEQPYVDVVIETVEYGLLAGQ